MGVWGFEWAEKRGRRGLEVGRGLEGRGVGDGRMGGGSEGVLLGGAGGV